MRWKIQDEEAGQGGHELLTRLFQTSVDPTTATIVGPEVYYLAVYGLNKVKGATTAMPLSMI